MDWVALRGEFPISGKWAFFDHAGVSPLPRRTAHVLEDYAADMSVNGSTAVARWVARTEETRTSVAQLLHCDPPNLALLKNTSEGICFVAEGFPWRDGDNAVLAAEEYPANQYPWMNLKYRGVSVRSVPSRGNRIAIDDLRDAMDGRTRLLAVSSVEFASGFRNDLDALTAMCHERGIAVCVDVIQSLGALPIDLARTPVEFMAGGGHKWLMGPQGTGFLYVRPDWIERLHPVSVGAFSVVDPTNYSQIDFTLKPNAGRWESGTMNFGGLAALGESVRLILDLGPPAIAERIRHLTEYLCDGVARAGFTVFSSREGGDWSGIVSFDKPGADLRAIVARAKTAEIVIAVRGGRLRAAPHCYNSEEELDRLIELLHG